MKKMTSIVLASALLAGCQGQGPKQTAGTFIGGAAGALAGSQIGGGRGQLVGVAVGTLAGAYLGGYIGKELDEKDKMMANQTSAQALEYAPDNQVSSWRNPNSGHGGDFVVTRTDQSGTGVCRDFTHTVMIGGKREKVFGRACRQTDGSWQIVN